MNSSEPPKLYKMFKFFVEITVQAMVFLGVVKILEVSNIYNLKVNKYFEPIYHVIVYVAFMGLSFWASYKSYIFVRKFNVTLKKNYNISEKSVVEQTERVESSNAKLEDLVYYIKNDRGGVWGQTNLGNLTITRVDTTFWRYSVSLASLDLQGKLPVYVEILTYKFPLEPRIY